MKTSIKKLNALFKPVDIASIVLFRISFGIIMLIEVLRYFDHNWIERYWINTEYHFPYWPFLSLEPLAGNGMIYLFVLLGILSVFISLGFLYRLSTALFFLGFTYMFLLEQSRYLNHFYLISLISFVLIFIPAHRSLSLDAKLFKNIRSEYVPAWNLWLIRLMIAIPLFFGGIAKLNPDWFAGQPLGIWLLNDMDFPLIGQFFDEKWMILIISYSGLLIDLLIVPLLIYKRTRVWAFLVGMLFHIMNANLFTIGIFPWFMMVSTTLFFTSSWPRTIVNRLAAKQLWPKPKIDTESISASKSNQKRVLFALGLWLFLMVALPLRHFFIPGNVSWTEAGHKYAWHMKLRTKRGMGVFIVVDEQKKLKKTIYSDDLMPNWQNKRVLTRPPMIWQFANKLKEEYDAKGYNVSVYADIQNTLNGRPYQQFTDPDVDLTKEPFPTVRANWILPLTEPLPKD